MKLAIPLYGKTFNFMKKAATLKVCFLFNEGQQFVSE